jgi:hypothetical protein
MLTPAILRKLNYDTENDIIPLDVSIEMNDLLSEVKSLVKCRKIYSEDGEENLLKALLELQKTNVCMIPIHST